MELALIGTVVLDIVFAIWAASLLWKYEERYGYGFIPILFMTIIGIAMMVIFSLYKPVALTLEVYVLILYGSSVAFFLIQLLVVYGITKEKRIASK